MAEKKFNFMNIIVLVNETETIHIVGYVKKIRGGFGEFVECEGRIGKYPYGNRPWEATRFEIALKDLAQQFGGERENAIKKWLENKIKQERGETEQYVKSFQRAVDGLTDKQRETFSNTFVETPEQAELLLKSVQACALLNKLL